MVKITHPVAHELGITKKKLDRAVRQLAEATVEIAALKDEVARLRQHVPPEFRRSSQSTSQNARPSRHTELQSCTPRYAQATRASEQRSAKLTTQTQNRSSENGTFTLTSIRSTFKWGENQSDCTRAQLLDKYQYRDGSLVNVHAGYLNTTQSSVAKLRPKIPRRPVESRTTPSETQPEQRLQTRSDDAGWDSEPAHQRSPTPASHRSSTIERQEFRRPCSLWWLKSVNSSPIKWSDTEYRDLVDLVTLLPATRLRDDELASTPMKHMFIDDGKQAELLLRGRELAQRCLWDMAERRLPGRNPWTTWRHVRLEWGVLSTDWDCVGIYHSSLGCRASEPGLVWFTVQAIIQLRHTTAHYCDSSNLFPSSLGQVDKHLENVQKLAIQLYDEQGALEARGLRDELRREARDTFEEITALGTLAALPFAGYPWQDHHERVFKHLGINAEDADAGRAKLDEHFPEEIGRIAEDWSWQNPRGHHEKYEPPVSLGICRGTPPKRRHSTSGCQDTDTISDLAARIKADREWERRFGYDTPYDVPEWLLGTDGRGVIESPQRARRRGSFSS